MPRWLRRFSLIVLILAVCLAAVYATRRMCLTALGRALILSEEPFQADAVIVLAGDDTGGRILKGAELVKRGFAPVVFVSGPWCCYGTHESALAIPFAIRSGYPAEWFIPLNLTSRSTREESEIIVRELDRRKIGKFVVVTSNYHTARAARVFRALVPASRFRMVAVTDPDFRPENWWHTRQGVKLLVMEWLKTLGYWMGH